ncbi:CHAT domain-containing protein [Aquimarina sediminis]|uniref:CHAT domain-containing protein n=1 Tax=Aquimarina sediminis TaxID=2070536 RepID=UPI000CA06BEE|nr:CHAT domain-containing protein [Aquimarina sediminis]
MNYRVLIWCCILAVFPLFGQNESYKRFKEILNSDIEFELKEDQSNTFLKKNISNISKKELADCYHEYGKWYFLNSQKSNQGHLIKKAILHTNHAASIKKEIPDLDSYSLLKTLFNLGYFHTLNNRFFDAINSYSEIVKINKSLKKTLQSYIGLGKVYIKTGDIHKGLHSFNQVIYLAKKDTLYRNRLIEGYLGRIDIYSLMGYKKYSDNIKDDLTKIDSTLNVSNLSKYTKHKYKNRLYQIEGNRLLKTKQYQKANIYFHKVLNGLHPHDSINLARVHNSIGVSFLHLKKLDSAQLYIQKSISLNHKFTNAYENLGDLHIHNQKFIKSLKEYQKAISLSISHKKQVQFDDLITTAELKVAVNKYYLLGHLTQKANCWIQYYHYDNNKDHLLQALKTFKVADQLVDIIRFESTAYKSKLFWREQGASLYMKAVETCYLLNKPEEAYYFMEKNKALLLLEDITNEQAKENAKLPVKIAQREFELKQAIHLSENTLNTAKILSQKNIQSIKEEIYQNKRNHEKFVDSISPIYPEYTASKKKIVILPYSKFTTQYISDKEVVLQYILNKNQGYGILTTMNQSMFFEINKTNQLHKDISDMQKQTSQWFSNRTQLNAYHEVSNRVFQKIIPSEVYSLIKEKKLIILPDYTLQQISFDALITSNQSHSYLIKDTEIRYAYSMSYLDQNNQIQRNPKYGFLGFAPITFDSSELSDLPYSEQETSTISTIFSGEKLLKEEATKSNFIDTIQHYKIIHLSTHAGAGDITGPWIAFKNENISLNEIYATKNQSDMIVLSACKTSVGELKQGEGIMSLARGFFYSGTKSVVSSLWSTNDKSNQELMIDFYKGIEHGETKASALRNAKLNYINSHTGSELSPFYWGSLILIGDNNPISIPSNLYYWYWIGVITILGLSTGVIYLRRRKRNILFSSKRAS